MRVRQNSVQHIKKQRHFTDLTNFAEFTMPEPLSWIRPDKNTKDSLLDRNGRMSKESKRNLMELTLENKYVDKKEDV